MIILQLLASAPSLSDTDVSEKLISLERVDRFTSDLLCSMSPFNKFRIRHRGPSVQQAGSIEGHQLGVSLRAISPAGWLHRGTSVQGVIEGHQSRRLAPSRDTSSGCH